jgi:hypothetical protein
MAEQIGIRLNLQGAAQVQGGLQGVTRSLGELDSKTLKVGDAFKALGPALTAALSVGSVAAWVNAAISATDQAGRLSQQLGIAVENLGGLEVAFRRTGLQADQMGPLLGKLSVAVANGNKALDAMGVSTRNADGSLRETMTVLREVMDRFASYRDGAAKTALAVGVFGEEGAKLIPLLNKGAAGMADFDRQARAMGLTVDNQAVEATRRFKEQVDLLQLGFAGLARTVAGPLVEALNKYLGIVQQGNFRIFPAEIESELRSLRARAAVSVAEDLEIAARRNPQDANIRREAERARNEANQRLREAAAANERLKGIVSDRVADQPAAVAAANKDAPVLPDLTAAEARRKTAEADRAIRSRQDVARLAREDAAQAAADEAARRAAQLQLESDEKENLARLARYDRAIADAEVAHQADLERIAQDALRQTERYDRAVIEAEAAHQSELEQLAQDALRQQQRIDTATLTAEQASAAALQRELELQADLALAAQQREFDAEVAADNAIQAERKVRAAQQLAEIARYDAAELAAEAAHQRELQSLADQALAQTQREYDAEIEATREYVRQRDAFREYLLQTGDEFSRAMIDDAAASQRYLADQAEAQKRALDSVTARTEQLQLEAQAADRAAAHNISLAEAIELVTIQRLREQQARYAQGSEGWEQIEREIQARQKLLTVMGQQRVQQANVDAAREAAAQWERTVDQVGQALADALMSGGQSAGQALKRYFSTLVLQPIIKAIADPMARGLMSMLGMGGAAGSAAAAQAGSTAAGSAPGVLGMLGMSGASLSAYTGLFTSAAKLASVSWQGTGMALSHAINAPLGQGLAMGAGTVAGMIGPAAIGQMVGRGISGGYSAMGGRSGSTAVNLGTAIGAIWGPLGAGIGAAIGGIVNRAFGTKLADTGVQGSFGGASGFTGQQFTFEKGGWFRSNRTTTEALSTDLQSILGGGFKQLRDDTDKMARDLGLASGSLVGFTRSIKVSLMGLSDEQIAQRLQQELGLVADEMARLVGGAAATADSLRQLYQQVMSERAQLETQLLQLQGNTAELRRRERDALHESNRALYDRIVALRDEQAATAAATASATTAAQDALAKQVSASQSAANAARQAADAYAQAGTSLRQTIAALLGGTTPGASAASAYRSGLVAAQAGDATAMGNLGALASTYAESLRGTARTRAEANIGAARIAAELQGVAALSDTLGIQRSVQAALLDINTAALQVLQEDLQNGSLTVDLLREHSTNLQKIAAALAANGVVVGQLQSNDQTTGGVIDEQARAADLLASSDLTLARVLAKLGEADPTNLLLVDRITSGNTLVADRLSQVISAINQQTAAQQAEVKRQQDLQRAQADLQSAAAYLGSLQSNVQTAQATLAGTPSTTSVRVGTRYDWLGFAKGGIYEQRANPAFAAAQQAEAEAQAALRAYEPQVNALRDMIRSLGGVPQFAMGGMHSGGLRIVGERGPELEATGPARYWSAADTTAMLGNGQRREELLAAEIRALRAEVQGLRTEARVTAVAANKTQRLWERVTRDGESMQITDVTPTP